MLRHEFRHAGESHARAMIIALAQPVAEKANATDLLYPLNFDFNNKTDFLKGTVPDPTTKPFADFG